MAETQTPVVLPAPVQAYFDAINAEDLAALEPLWSPTAELRAVGSRRRRGLAEVMDYFRPLFDPWAEHLDQPTRVIGEGDAVVVEIRFAGRTVQGRELSFDALDVFDLAAGRIERLTTWYDLAWLRKQL
ncbi:MAG: nuclear transport factor 2 family protein [Solirubrobacterales bacterium]